MGACHGRRRDDFIGNGLDAYKMWIEKTLNGGDTFAGKACYAPLKEAYRQSLDVLINATTQETLVAELPRFTMLYDSIKVNIAAYEDFCVLLDDAKAMVVKASYAGDDFYTLADYVDFDIEPNEEFPNGNAAYILENGTLTTEQLLANDELTDDQRASLQVAMALDVDKSDATAPLSVIAQIREVMDTITDYITTIEPTSFTSRPSSSTIVGIYSLRGDKIDNLQKGINIVRMSNGQVRKIVVK